MTALDRHAWDTALAAYLAAKAAELTFDEAHVDPLVRADLPPGPERRAAVDRIPKIIWAESGRLADVRHDAENTLMAIQSPDLMAFAHKFLISFGDGRDTDRWTAMLEAEARLFIGEVSHG